MAPPQIYAAIRLAISYQCIVASLLQFFVKVLNCIKTKIRVRSRIRSEGHLQ